LDNFGGGSTREKGIETWVIVVIIAGVIGFSAIYVLPIIVYYATTVPAFPVLAAVIVESDNNIIGLRIVSPTHEIPSTDWKYSVTTTEGTRDWKAGVKPIGIEIETVNLGGERSPDNYYVSVVHAPTGHEWISDFVIEIT
jgi:hypothetical protein